MTKDELFLVIDELVGVQYKRRQLKAAVEECLRSQNSGKHAVSGSLPQGNVALLTTALRHVAEWSDKEEDMWDDPGYCAIEALKNYEASKRQ